MGEVVHERYEPSQSFYIAPFVQPFAQLDQLIVNAQKLLISVIINHVNVDVSTTYNSRARQIL
jgi:hypothetical protein